MRSINQRDNHNKVIIKVILKMKLFFDSNQGAALLYSFNINTDRVLNPDHGCCQGDHNH